MNQKYSMRIMRFNIPDTFTPSFLHDEILKIHNHNSDLDHGRARISVYRSSSGNYNPESNDISYIIKTSEIHNNNYEFLNKDSRVDLYKDYLIDNNNMIYTTDVENPFCVGRLSNNGTIEFKQELQINTD